MKPTSPSCLSPSSTCDAHDVRDARGFTLIEVMVALSAGVLVAIATFALSKNATTFFQREARISSAQLALTLGMNRLTQDIQRASMLSTANIKLDPNVCSATSSSWPAGLQRLAGITILSTKATGQGANQSPAIAPDQIIIGGSLDSADVYQVQNITTGPGGAPLLTIRGPAADPASYRATAQCGSGETLLTKVAPVFYPNTWPSAPATSGRIGHIYLPDSNMNWYGVISTVALSTSGALQIQMASSPGIPQKPGVSCGIGVGDIGAGWLFSVVSRVQYSVQSVASSPQQYAQLVSPQQAAVSGDSGRTELIRQELDATNTPIANAIEVVAEYAVDLAFGITTSSLVANTSYNPTVTSWAFGSPSVYSFAGDITTGGTPEIIRGVQVRLSTRTRLPDRDTNLPVGSDGRRLRFLVDSTLQSPYARVRTNYANVALPNQGGFSLW